MNPSPLLLLLLCLALAAPAAADIPPLRLDGSYDKAPLYRDDYPYTPLDYDAAVANPLRVGVKRRIAIGDPGYDDVGPALDASRRPETETALKAKWVKVVRKEFDLTAKEKETVAANPRWFPEEQKSGKRVMNSWILAIGGKEYPAGGCRLLGEGDWDGDGSPELFLRYDDGHTHAGAGSQIRVFTAKGDFVWCADLQTIYMGRHGVVDLDGDGKVELVIDPGSSPHMFPKPDPAKSGYAVLACAGPGETLEPFGDRSDRPSRPPVRDAEPGPRELMIQPPGGLEIAPPGKGGRAVPPPPGGGKEGGL